MHPTLLLINPNSNQELTRASSLDMPLGRKDTDYLIWTPNKFLSQEISSLLRQLSHTPLSLILVHMQLTSPDSLILRSFTPTKRLVAIKIGLLQWLKSLKLWKEMKHGILLPCLPKNTKYGYWKHKCHSLSGGKWCKPLVYETLILFRVQAY